RPGHLARLYQAAWGRICRSQPIFAALRIGLGPAAGRAGGVHRDCWGEAIMVPLSWYLILAAALFCIGLYGVLARKNAVAILMGIELMLNAVNINLVAFWHYLTSQIMAGQMFTLIVLTVAAAEAAVGLALIISIYRRRSTVIAEDIDLLKW